MHFDVVLLAAQKTNQEKYYKTSEGLNINPENNKNLKNKNKELKQLEGLFQKSVPKNDNNISMDINKKGNKKTKLTYHSSDTNRGRSYIKNNLD